MSERTDPTRQAAQRLLEWAREFDMWADYRRPSATDVRLVAEAVMERNNQSIIGARSAENAESCACPGGWGEYECCGYPSECRDVLRRRSQDAIRARFNAAMTALGEDNE